MRAALLPAFVPLAALALVLSGCAPATSGPGTSSESPPKSGQKGTTAESLVGSYSVEYTTTESDRDAITGGTVVRNAEVTGSCEGDQCDLSFTTEIKLPDGSPGTTTTVLVFDGTTFSGTGSLATSCDGMTTLTTVEDGILYNFETTITPTATAIENGHEVVKSFKLVSIESNEITPSGRAAGCLMINPSGPDPFATHATVAGVGTRQP